MDISPPSTDIESNLTKVTLLLNGTEACYTESTLKNLDYFKTQLSPTWNREGALSLSLDGVETAHMDLLVTRLEGGQFPEGQHLDLVIGTARLCKFLSASELFAELVDYFENKMPGVPINDVYNVACQDEFPEFSKLAIPIMECYVSCILNDEFIINIITDMSVAEENVLKKLEIVRKFGNDDRSGNRDFLERAFFEKFYPDKKQLKTQDIVENKDLLFRIWRLMSSYWKSETKPANFFWGRIGFRGTSCYALSDIIFNVLDTSFALESRSMFERKVVVLVKSYRCVYANEQTAEFEEKLVMYLRKCTMRSLISTCIIMDRYKLKHRRYSPKLLGFLKEMLD
eukprot:400241_1